MIYQLKIVPLNTPLNPMIWFSTSAIQMLFNLFVFFSSYNRAFLGNFIFFKPILKCLRCPFFLSPLSFFLMFDHEKKNAQHWLSSFVLHLWGTDKPRFREILFNWEGGQLWLWLGRYGYVSLENHICSDKYGEIAIPAQEDICVQNRYDRIRLTLFGLRGKKNQLLRNFRNAHYHRLSKYCQFTHIWKIHNSSSVSIHMFLLSFLFYFFLSIYKKN